MSNGTPKRFPADLKALGEAWGWKQAHPENLPAVEQVLAAGGAVALIQDSGRRDWLPDPELLPRGVAYLESWPTDLSRFRALIAISDRKPPLLDPGLASRTVLYHPQTLTLGVSCFRGVLLEELTACVERLFRQGQLAQASLTAIGVPASRKNEAALVDFAEDRSLPLLAYPAKALAVLAGTGRRANKMAGLCVPSALLAAGVKELAIPKQTFGRLSLAVARRPWG